MILTAALIMTLGAAPEAPEIPPPVTPAFGVNEKLQGYIDLGAATHPELRAQYDAWLAALERVPQARALEDPMLMFGQMLSANNFPTMIEIQQRLPWFGTRAARVAVVEAEAEAALQTFLQTRNEIVASIKEAYFRYALVLDEIEIMGVQQMILDYVRDIIEIRLSLGLAREDELLRIDTERELLADALAMLRKDSRVALARLNTAIGLPVGTPQPEADDTPFPATPPAFETVLEDIAQNNPGVEALARLVEARRNEQERARAEGRPSFVFELEYMRVRETKSAGAEGYGPSRIRESSTRTIRERLNDPATPFVPGPRMAPETPGMDMRNEQGWELRVGMSLPIYRKKIRAAVREAEYDTRRAEWSRRALMLELEAEAYELLQEQQDAERRHRLFGESLIPLALDTYESLQNGFSAGLENVSFLDLLGAIQQVLDFQLQQAEAAYAWQVALTKLETLMGGGWE